MRDLFGSFRRRQRVGYALVVLAVFGIGIVANVRTWTPPASLNGYDINYVYIEGQRILYGQNPYSRILSGDMQTNEKYATYFPIYYELSALSQAAGLSDFESWVIFWRWVFLLFNLGIAVLLFNSIGYRRAPLLAVGAAGFWILNRWTLDVSHIAHIDFAPIFFLLLSLTRFSTNRRSSEYFLSISLGLKQLAIFVVPLYLIWNYNDRKTLARSFARIFSVPIAAALPFLIWDLKGFVLSILFSMTRNPDGHFDAASAGEVLGLTGDLLRAPLLLVLGFCYLAAHRKEVGRYLVALLVVAVFVDFNPVLFRQYMVWLVALVPLVYLDKSASTEARTES